MGGGRAAEMLSRYGGAAAVVAAATAVTVISITARRVASVDVVADLQVRLGTALSATSVDTVTDTVAVSFVLCGGYNYDSTSIRRPFDGHSVA